MDLQIGFNLIDIFLILLSNLVLIIKDYFKDKNWNVCMNYLLSMTLVSFHKNG